MRQHARIAPAGAGDFMIQDHCVKARNSGVVGRNQTPAPARQVLGALHFDAKISLHQFQEKMWQKLEQQRVAVGAHHLI